MEATLMFSNVMFAGLGDTLRDVGSVCGAIVAILGLLALMSRLRPVRYVWRHLVTEPFGYWFREQVREELDRENGGSTLKDTVKQTKVLAERSAIAVSEIKDVLGIGDENT